jgi:hypothetical protein
MGDMGDGTGENVGSSVGTSVDKDVGDKSWRCLGLMEV